MSIKNTLGAPSMGVLSICLDFLILCLKYEIIFLPITLIHPETSSALSQSSAVNRKMSRKIRRFRIIYFFLKDPVVKLNLYFYDNKSKQQVLI